MQDNLEEIIERVKSKKFRYITLTKSSFELISFENFGAGHIPAIRDFQTKVFEKFGIRLNAVDGGSGCSKIVFEIESDSLEEARITIQKLLENLDFREEAVKAKFTIAIATQPYTRVELKKDLPDELNQDKGLLFFCSYSHQDKTFKEALDAHTSLLKRQGLIQIWHDREILPGDDFADKINKNLEMADIVLLLVSSDYLASNYCFSVEMKRALESHSKNQTRIIPLIIRPVDWETAPFGHITALPRDGKAISLWSNQDEAWQSVIKEIRKTVISIKENLRVKAAP